MYVQVIILLQFLERNIQIDVSSYIENRYLQIMSMIFQAIKRKLTRNTIKVQIDNPPKRRHENDEVGMINASMRG